MNKITFEFPVDKTKIIDCARKIYEQTRKATLYSSEDVKNGNFEKIEGVYLFVEVDEKDKNLIKRIVRVGTHTQNKYLQSRLKSHFNGNNSSSVFRKMIFNALEKRDKEKIQNQTVSKEIRKYKFVVIDTAKKEKKERLEIESKVIATLSWSALLSSDFRDESDNSLFAYADDRTRLFGLWLKNGLLGEPYKNIEDIAKLNFFSDNKRNEK